MGPIEKKITEILKTENMSEETKLVLNHLKSDVKLLEKELVNQSYQQGFYDKEIGRTPSWDYYSKKFHTYMSTIKFGQL
jgi:hypothetical protein